MDQDYQVDMNLRAKVLQQRELVIDLNYPDELTDNREKYDSLKTTDFYQRFKNETCHYWRQTLQG
jgi:hypothetical protein